MPHPQSPIQTMSGHSKPIIILLQKTETIEDQMTQHSTYNNSSIHKMVFPSLKVSKVEVSHIFVEAKTPTFTPHLLSRLGLSVFPLNFYFLQIPSFQLRYMLNVSVFEKIFQYIVLFSSLLFGEKEIYTCFCFSCHSYY